MNSPPHNLVCISTIPKEKWVGRKIYHPLSQTDKPHWRECDDPHHLDNPSTAYEYDVGVVVSYTAPPDDEAEWYPYHQIKFTLTEFEDREFGRIILDPEAPCTLIYPEYNIWTEPLP
jgi:hypothetical protein